MNDHSDMIKNLTEDFLSRLSITGTVDVIIDETGAYRVHIQTEETGLLIGHHGKTLESFQILLGLIVMKAVGEKQRVYVNVGDYREKREETLMHMAQSAAERALASGKPVELSYLSPAERRVVHLTLSGDDRVMTVSEGEEPNRTLVVKVKI